VPKCAPQFQLAQTIVYIRSRLAVKPDRQFIAETAVFVTNRTTNDTFVFLLARGSLKLQSPDAVAGFRGWKEGKGGVEEEEGRERENE